MLHAIHLLVVFSQPPFSLRPDMERSRDKRKKDKWLHDSLRREENVPPGDVPSHTRLAHPYYVENSTL